MGELSGQEEYRCTYVIVDEDGETPICTEGTWDAGHAF